MKLIMPKLLFAVRFKRRCHWIMLESGEKREEEKRFFHFYNLNEIVSNSFIQ